MSQTLTYVMGSDRRAHVDNIQDFKVDFSEDNHNWVQARQFERGMRQVFVNVVNEDGTPFDLTGCNVWFEGLLPKTADGDFRVIDDDGYVPLDPSAGKFRFDMPGHAFTVAGSYRQAFFRIVKNGNSVTTLEFDLDVLADKVIDGLVPKDWIGPFEEIADKLVDDLQKHTDDADKILADFQKKVGDLIAQLNQQGSTTTSMLTELQNRISELETKIKSEHLFTEDEAKQLENRLALKLNTGFEHIYETVDEMLSDQALGAGMYVKTAGYYTVNDGGGAGYVITSKEPANYSEKLNNGLFAELLYGSEPVNVLNFGVKNDGTQDCSKLVNEQTKIHALYFPAGKYLANEQLDIYHNLYGEVGPAGMSKDEKGLTTIKSGITGDNTKSLICNHGDSTIISKLNLHLNDNENGITDNGKYVTRLNNIYIDGIKNACGIKIDRPGSRASIIDDVFVNSAGAEYNNTGLYYLTGTDELLSNFWSMGCSHGIFAVCCLFYATNIHIWGGPNNADSYALSRGAELHRSKAFFTNLYTDTVRFALSSDGNSYISVNNFIYLYDDSLNSIIDKLSWNGFFDTKKSDYVEITGGYTFVPKFGSTTSLLDPSHVRINRLLITVPEEKNAEDYLTEYYRNYLPNMIMGYDQTYQLGTEGMDGKYVEIARIPIKENMFGQVVLKISDAHINNCLLTVELNDGTASLVDTGGNHYEDIAYKIINNWFVVFSKQRGEYDSNQVSAIQLGGLGPVNYNYIRVTDEKPFPRLVQDDDNGLTHLHADSSASNA